MFQAAKKIDLDRKTKKIIGFADPSYDLKTGSYITVAGWGKVQVGKLNTGCHTNTLSLLR